MILHRTHRISGLLLSKEPNKNYVYLAVLLGG